MNKKVDAIIIGAGVIGSSVAFELAKRGYKTLNIDKLPTSGYGSTSNSCAIVRAHYSTWDGVAMAYEGFFYWDDWANYLGVEDERGMIKYMKTGSIMFKLQGEDHSKKSLKLFEEIELHGKDLSLKLYGARALIEGGLQSLPKMYMPGALLVLSLIHI